jgi:hypothetical protein
MFRRYRYLRIALIVILSMVATECNSITETPAVAPPQRNKRPKLPPASAPGAMPTIECESIGPITNSGA